MTPEERFERIERHLEFLAVSMQSHDSQISENYRQFAESARQIGENARQIGEHTRQIGELAAHAAQNSSQIAQLTDLTLHIGRAVEVQGRRMDELAESQRHTDERLNALIAIVERYFSDGRE
jgi:methyl-accepting chemotaxis protein